MIIKGQIHSLTFIQSHSDSTFSIFFCSETTRRIEAKFHMEPPLDVGNENLFKCSRSHDHAHIWWKTSKIFFWRTKRPMTLKLGIQHWVLEHYQCFHVVTTERSDQVLLNYVSGRHLNAGSPNQNQDVHKLKWTGFNKLIHVTFRDNLTTGMQH